MLGPVLVSTMIALVSPAQAAPVVPACASDAIPAARVLSESRLREEALAAFLGRLLLEVRLTPDQFLTARERERSRLRDLSARDLAFVVHQYAGSPPQPCGTTPTEAFLIRNYTGHDTIRLNEFLRGVCRECVKEVRTVMNRGLAQLRAVTDTVLRFTDLPLAIAREYVPGHQVCAAAYTSSSANPNWEWAGRYRFEIHSKRGRSIAAFSQFPNEAEVLFREGTCFRVLKRTDGADVTTIEMEELDSVDEPAL